MGLTAYETVGSANVTIVVQEGGSSGKVIDVAVITKGTSVDPHWFGPNGIRVNGQLYVTVSGSGTPGGAVFVR